MVCVTYSDGYIEVINISMANDVKINFHKPTADQHFLWDEVEYFLYAKTLSKKYIDMIMDDDHNNRLFQWLRDENITDYTYTINLTDIIFTFNDKKESDKFSRKWIYDRMYFLYTMSLLETLEMAYSDMFYIRESYISNVVSICNRDTDDVVLYHGMVSTTK